MFTHASSKLMLQISLSLLFVLTIILNPHISEAKRTVRAGVYNFKPMVYSDTNGSPKGFFVDILDHIAKKANWEMQYVAGSWQEGLDRLKNNQIDLILCVGYGMC